MSCTPRSDVTRWMASAILCTCASLSITQGPAIRNSCPAPTWTGPISNSWLTSSLNHEWVSWRRLRLRTGPETIQFRGIIGKESDGLHVGVSVDGGLGITSGTGNLARTPRDGVDQNGGNIMMAKRTGRVDFRPASRKNLAGRGEPLVGGGLKQRPL